jgi:hypothetical protein
MKRIDFLKAVLAADEDYATAEEWNRPMKMQ